LIEFSCLVLYSIRVADLLPKSFDWTLAVYPFLGSIVVALLSYLAGSPIRNGVDFIAQSIDEVDSNDQIADKSVDMFSATASVEPHPGDFVGGTSIKLESKLHSQMRTTETNMDDADADTTIMFSSYGGSKPSRAIREAADAEVQESNDAVPVAVPVAVSGPKSWFPVAVSASSKFNPFMQLIRILAAVSTLGSGCSLGPEGPAVEIGTGLSRLIGGTGSDVSAKQKHWLFLSGASAGVAAGFNAPITGVFFAIEVGNRYLAKNTIRLNEEAPDGPRADIAAIVLSSALAYLTVGLGLHESQALAVTGNAYPMQSPLFELSQYIGLGLISGGIAVGFGYLKDVATELFEGQSWAAGNPLTKIPVHLRPVIGGLVCGLAAGNL
jgi:hypothetical protein